MLHGAGSVRRRTPDAPRSPPRLDIPADWPRVVAGDAAETESPRTGPRRHCAGASGLGPAPKVGRHGIPGLLRSHGRRPRRDPGRDQRATAVLARKYHPDVSKEPDAELRFKALGEALRGAWDLEKRAAYDRFGSDWQPGPDFQAAHGPARRRGLLQRRVQRSVPESI